MPSSNYQTLGQIRSAIIRDAKESSSTNLITQVNRWINEGYELVVFRKKRDWLDQKFTIQTVSCVNAVCTVTQGSTSVTFTSTLSLSSTAELIFWQNGFSEVYDIASVSTHSITLSAPYLGAGNTAASGFITQPSIILNSSIRNIYQVYHQWLQCPLTEVGPQMMRQIQEQYGPDVDYARYATLFGTTSSGAKRMILYPYPNSAYTLYVDANTYITPLSADADEPVIPMQHRQVLYHWGMYKLFSYHRNDVKMAEHLGNYKAVLNDIDGEAKTNMDFPKLSVKYPKGRNSYAFTPGFDKRLRD